ncbi:hypothetical protein NDU88_004569 [Pleurodeles waltl]|uniref:Uncharacterized protein n=1 Tax=Pleurodeles waltl TaxID=8319 RepID=A0AAV7RKU9_PLEWA|nr:hypothetical protein NDU88_004569 [Pleurodeles waltl]
MRILLTGPRAPPPGARGSGCSVGDSDRRWEYSARPGLLAAERTRSRPLVCKGGRGGPRSDTTADQAPRSPLPPRLLTSQSGGATAALTPPARTKEPARAETSRRQATRRSSAPRAPAAIKPGPDSADRAPGGKPQEPAPPLPRLGWIMPDKIARPRQSLTR